MLNDEDQLDMFLNVIRNSCHERSAVRAWQVLEDIDYSLLAYYVLSVVHAVRERPFPFD